MAKKVKSDDFKFEIEEFIGTLKESDKHDWCKAIARISWNENPATLDIRNINLANNRIGKGISLADEEVDRLVNSLLENDYGSLESLQAALKRKRNRFTIVKDAESCFDDDNKFIINISI